MELALLLFVCGLDNVKSTLLFYLNNMVSYSKKMQTLPSDFSVFWQQYLFCFNELEKGKFFGVSDFNLRQYSLQYKRLHL